MILLSAIILRHCCIPVSYGRSFSTNSSPAEIIQSNYCNILDQGRYMIRLLCYSYSSSVNILPIHPAIYACIAYIHTLAIPMFTNKQKQKKSTCKLSHNHTR
ncbi:hypothetical protein L873DRAFT_549823 [Choiromyces venosus 120613-1]|uniref:Secreted protein n=1 Tax=Choiromyces venosus 120613-1 TaxID=1336337 RepID=A0A3N4K911_9PEZI|nr:hypothetical protein L873DRAFT_549823 [Choiromyces venosus 120613-1]